MVIIGPDFGAISTFLRAKGALLIIIDGRGEKTSYSGTDMAYPG